MDPTLRERFLELWRRHFPAAELPIVFFYAGDPGDAEPAAWARGHRCLIDDLRTVRAGKSLAFGTDALGCMGARRYLGFADTIRPDFEYFLSCGVPGRMEGERYIRTPELVREMMERMAPLPAGGPLIVFKRWDRLAAGDEPAAAVFFAPPDVLSGLFTLANFERAGGDGVTAPFGAGCTSVVYHPLREAASASPRAVLGLFDVSARPFVPPGVLTFAVPIALLARMVETAGESFLSTSSWAKVAARLGQDRPS